MASLETLQPSCKRSIFLCLLVPLMIRTASLWHAAGIQESMRTNHAFPALSDILSTHDIAWELWHQDTDHVGGAGHENHDTLSLNNFSAHRELKHRNTHHKSSQILSWLWLCHYTTQKENCRNSTMQKERAQICKLKKLIALSQCVNDFINSHKRQIFIQRDRKMYLELLNPSVDFTSGLNRELNSFP